VKIVATVIVRLFRLLAATAATVGLVVGVPYLLTRFVGNPLPTAVPSLDDLVLDIQSRQLDDVVLIRSLAMIIWLAWAQLVFSLALEIKTVAAGASTSTIRGFGAAQWLARRLVAQFTVASTLFVQGSVGLVLPPTAVLADTAPAEVVDGTVEVVLGHADLVGGGALVEVTSSDTLWDLAVVHLGSGDRWVEIRDANVGRSMPDGTVLPADFVAISGPWSLLVPGSQASAPVLAESPGEVIGAWRVAPGDHFWNMAETVLTEGWGRQPTEEEVRHYWLDIVAHNRGHLISPGNDPDVIYVDQSFEILIPPLPADADGAGDHLAANAGWSLNGIPQFDPIVARTPGLEAPGLPRTAEPTGHTPDSAATGDGPLVVLSDEGAELADRDQNQRPAATRVPRGESPAPGETDDSGQLTVDGRIGQALAVGGVGLSAVAASLMLNSLRARGRALAARRRPDSAPELPDDLHLQFESRVRAIADHEAVRWLTATNRFLTRSLADGEVWQLPAIIAVRAGEHGVEILLDEETPPPRGFLDGSQPGAWILDPDIEVRQLERESAAADVLPYAPLLQPVGSTGGGDLLLELAQLGVIGLAGPDAAITGWLRALAVAVASSQWAEGVRVIAVGVDPALERVAPVEVPADPVAWARDEVERRRCEGPQPKSRYEHRIAGDLVPELLVLVGPGHEGIAQHLADVAQWVNTPLTLIAAAPVNGEARIQFEGDRATLEPTGITFWPSVMDSEAMAMTTGLLQQPADGGSGSADVADWSGDAVQDQPVAEAPELLVEPFAIDEADDESPASEPVELIVEPPPFVPVAVEGDSGRDGPSVGVAAVPSAVDVGSIELGESSSVRAEIDAVMVACPVEVAVLRPIPQVEGTIERLTPKNLSVLAYLAFHRSVTSSSMREVFWASSVNRSTSDNAISLIRRNLGAGSDGQPRLNLASEGRFTVSDEVGCDWARFELLHARAEEARRAGEVAEEMALLRAALDLVLGGVACDADAKHWMWLRDDPLVYSRVESAIVDAAHRLGGLACEAKLPELARWAADKGLAVVPEQEALYRIQMSAASIAGDEAGLSSVFRQAERSAQNAGSTIQPETETLFGYLVGSSKRRESV
jgi:DNA-binding SARP family transcriptional activator